MDILLKNWRLSYTRGRGLMSHVKPRFAAVDATFLIALASGDLACQATVDFLGKLRLYIIVTPASLQALQETADKNLGTRIGDLAQEALSSIALWGFLKDGLPDLETHIGANAAQYVQKSLGLTHTQSRVLTEVPLSKADLLLTNDPSLLNLDNPALELIILGRDLDSFLIFDPIMFSNLMERLGSG